MGAARLARKSLMAMVEAGDGAGCAAMPKHASVLGARNKEGATALMAAYGAKKWEVAEALARRMSKTQLELRARDGWSALDWACRSGHAPAAALLKSLGVEIDGHSGDGITALMLAAAWSENSAVVEALLVEGADPLAVDDEGQDALHCAVYAGQLEAAAALAPVGGPGRDNEGHSALSRACHVGPAYKQTMRGEPTAQILAEAAKLEAAGFEVRLRPPTRKNPSA